MTRKRRKQTAFPGYLPRQAKGLSLADRVDALEEVTLVLVKFAHGVLMEATYQPEAITAAELQAMAQSIADSEAGQSGAGGTEVE